MNRLSIAEAVAIAPVSQSTLRRDIKSGKVSAERDGRGHYRIDPAELSRVYGTLKMPEDTQETPVDTAKVMTLLEQTVDDLKSQLEKAEAREKKLMDMLSVEQQKTRLLLPAPPKAGWLHRLLGLA